jgi:hypothetical protein
MRIPRNSFLVVLMITLLYSCKSKKPSLAGEDPVEMSDFIDFFPDVKLSYQFNDSAVLKKGVDSLLISYKVFTQFVPDSVMYQFFGKNVKPKIYPMGKTKVSGGETYLFVKAIAGDKKSALLFAFDKKDVYMDGMELLKVDQYASTQQLASMDKGYSISKTIVRKNPDASISEGKDVYGLSNDTRKFNLIMTDALDDKMTELANPIDTFSRSFKYAADYGSGKMNLVSIRDGRKKDRLRFFIHFEKNNGACTGELKGEAIIKSPTVAEYRLGGDPCVLRFTFTATAVILKEMEGCGAHRGLRCSFDGPFGKKKEAKAAKGK